MCATDTLWGDFNALA